MSIRSNANIVVVDDINDITNPTEGMLVLVHDDYGAGHPPVPPQTSGHFGLYIYGLVSGTLRWSFVQVTP